MVLGPTRRGRKVVYAVDTIPREAVVSLARGADLLVHDATTAADPEEKANAHGHSSSRQAAEIARRASVKMLALVHLSPRYDDTTQLLNDARAHFPNTILPKDLDELEIRLSE